MFLHAVVFYSGCVSQSEHPEPKGYIVLPFLPAATPLLIQAAFGAGVVDDTCYFFSVPPSLGGE